MVKKVAISIPNESHVPVEAYDNHLNLASHIGKIQEVWRYEKREPRYEFGWFTTGRLLTAYAREKLAENAIKEGFDYLLMLDNDMLYPIDTVESLLLDIEQHPEIDVLAPLAFMRGRPHYAVMYMIREGYDEEMHTSYFINEFVKNYPKDKLVECDAVGFGAVIIKVSLLKKMKPPYFMSTAGCGEDIWFCHKAKKENDARIFMDTRIKLGHLGFPSVIDEEYREKYKKDNNEKVEEYHNHNKYGKK